MRIEKFLKIASELHLEAKMMLETKNEDYSKGDAFGAFEKEAKICGILELDASKREHRALAQIITKVVMLKGLENRDPHHESIRDTCADGINFFTLYYGMRTEEKEEKK